MVVVVGWGSGEARDLGEVAPLVCPNCHNPVFLHQIHSQKRVSLYFVPLMSYGSNEYLACPICRAGLEVGPQHRAAVDQMRYSTRMYQQGQLSADQYQPRVDQFWATMGIDASGQPASPAPPAAPVPPTIGDRLQNLGKLHADGVLTDEEFTAAKRRVLEE